MEELFFKLSTDKDGMATSLRIYSKELYKDPQGRKVAKVWGVVKAFFVFFWETSLTGFPSTDFDYWSIDFAGSFDWLLEKKWEIYLYIVIRGVIDHHGEEVQSWVVVSNVFLNIHSPQNLGKGSLLVEFCPHSVIIFSMGAPTLVILLGWWFAIQWLESWCETHIIPQKQPQRCILVESESWNKVPRLQKALFVRQCTRTALGWC